MCGLFGCAGGKRKMYRRSDSDWESAPPRSRIPAHWLDQEPLAGSAEGRTALQSLRGRSRVRVGVRVRARFQATRSRSPPLLAGAAKCLALTLTLTLTLRPLKEKPSLTNAA